MRKLTTREIILLSVCFIGIIGFAYYRYFFTPIESELNSLSSSINDAQQQIILLEKTVQQLPEIKADYTELTTVFEEKKSEYIMDSYNQVTMIAQLQEMIDQRATGKSVSFSEPSQQLYLEENPELGSYVVETISLSFTTTEDGWVELLNTFENTYSANKIGNFSVSPTGEETIVDEEGNVTTLPSQVSVSMSVEFYADKVVTEPIEFVGEDQYNYQANGVFE